MIHIHYVTSPIDATVQALALLDHAMNTYLGRPLLFLVSGGSALRIFEKPSHHTDFSTVTFGVLDERFTLEKSAANFRTFTETPYYTSAKHHGASILEMAVRHKETLLSYGKRIDKAIGDWMNNNKRGKVIITQGIGADGHTAGIIPNPDKPEDFLSLFVNTERLFVGYQAYYSDNPYKERATVTLYFLKKFVDVSIVYVLGEDKRTTVEKVLTEHNVINTPAAILQEMKDVHIVTDIQGFTHKTLPT